MSHSLKIISSLTKVTSPEVKRSLTRLSRGAFMSTSQSPPGQSDKKAPPLPPKKTKAHKEEAQVAEKGETYKAGESYFSFNPYSFYDFEKDMHKHRAPQPSSLPKEKYYCNEVEPMEEEEAIEIKPPQQRRLLPNPWGYLVEWPGMNEVKVQEAKKKQVKVKKRNTNDYVPVVENVYPVKRDPKKDPFYKARINL
ncbi:hypothetical protein BgiMline_024978 [Biomphalaria glabrata]|nr:hypothetical protein BgiMline_008140 [Biomphalaria glabrata]